VDRLASLVDIFAIDLCAYAVMSNHYHVVLKVDRVRASNWTQREVAEHCVHSPLVRQWRFNTNNRGRAPFQ
jgi:hypothetical protein